jgi:hypothetical protein
MKGRMFRTAECSRGALMTCFGSLSVVVAMCLSCDPPQDAEIAKFMSAEGTLIAPLVVQDSQSGVAGRVGVEIAVEPNGAWTKTKFWGTRRRQPIDGGQLTPNQLARLARIMAQQDFSSLPKESGKTDPTSNPNPRYISLAFGNEKAELLLPPRTDLAEFVEQVPGDEKKLIRRFDQILRSVQQSAVK